MLSYHAWQQEYGSDPRVVGSTFILNGHPFTVVGITPPGFFGETLRSDPPALWIPLKQEPMLNGNNSILHRFSAWLRVIGRLKPGATPNALPSRLTNLLRGWLVNESGFPAEWMAGIKAQLPKQKISVVPAGTGVGVMKADYSASLHILLGVCGLVLLIACANIANLLLARGAARRAQTAVRLALGASRRRLMRQSLTESVVLSVMGGLLGLAVAFLGVKLMVVLAFHGARYVPIDAAPSLPVLGFAFLLSLLTGVLFRDGSGVAGVACRAGGGAARRQSQHADRSSFSQKALVVVQATLSVVLLAGAGLLTQEFAEAGASGFRLRDESSGDDQPDGALQLVSAAEAGCDVPRAAGPAGAYSRRGAGSVGAVHTVTG